MKFSNHFKKITVISSLISISVIILTISFFYFNMSFNKFNKEVESLRLEYYNTQKDIIKNEIYKVFDYISYQRSLIENRLKKEIKNRVYEAHNLADNIYLNNNDKSDDEILKMITDALRMVRFNDGSGYYFVIRLDGTELLSPINPKLEGKNTLNVKDSQNRYVTKEMIDLVKNNEEGYYEYNWNKPNKSGNDHKKISFIKYFEPLDILIGAGLYFEDLEKVVKKEIIDRIANIRYNNDGYIFVTTYDGIALVFSDENYIGKSIRNIVDVNGLNIHNEEMKIIKSSGEGYVKYHWKKPVSDNAFPKIAFVKGLDDWNWIIGTGVYIDEIEKTIKIKEINLKKEIIIDIFNITSILIFVGFILLLIKLYILKRVEKTIKEEERLYETLTNLSEDGIFILKPNGKILDINHKGLDMINYSKNETLKINFTHLIDEKIFNGNIIELSNKDTYLRNKFGSIIPIELNIKSIEIDRKLIFIAYARDLTERKIYENTLKEIAMTDELTDIYNRRYIINKLNSEIDKIRNTNNIISIALVDIDKFKDVNDTYGHVFGDKVLREFTKTFKDNLRKCDYFGRYGGEEFLIILSNTTKNTAYNIISRVKDIFSDIKWEHDDLKISFSAGIIEVKNTNKSPEELLNDVDELLYKAKNNGRDRIEKD